MLAMAHDYRIMRDDFGHLAVNEIEIGVQLPPGLIAVVQ